MDKKSSLLIKPTLRSPSPELFCFVSLCFFRKVYGGIPTACHLPNNPDEAVGRVIKDVSNKWYDGKYLDHTMNGLDCYPVYMQVLLIETKPKVGIPKSFERFLGTLNIL